MKVLDSKQELLFLLLENEQQRITTWLNPLDPSKKQGPGHNVRPVSEITLNSMVHTAWNEAPALAVHMPARFPGKRYHIEVRKLMLMYPEKVVGIPEALMLFLGDHIPNDVNFQLKVSQFRLQCTRLC